MEYLERYTPEQARRHEVRPGITGLAQIRGRHMLEWEERFKLDVWYVDHWSLALDFEIMRDTFRQVLFGKGIPPRGTPDWYFMGSAATAAPEATTPEATTPATSADDSVRGEAADPA
jgi:hypothetical protein